jgi:alpha-tubulin suppressor-like RCC1 family protein
MRQQQVSVRAKLVAVLFLSLVAVLLAPSGCATNTVDQPDTGTPVEAGPPNPCGPGTAKQCNGVCIDVQNDAQNCGDCGTVCPSDKVCSHGQCAAVCGGGTAHCGNFCVDLKADPLNCGGCNTKCPSGQVCNKAACALTCQAGLTDCNGGCVDTTSDDFNCAACGNACDSGKHCVNGSCQATCQSGWSSCSDGTDGGTTCVDTTNDPNNCNSCGNKCPNGYFCQNGVCGIQCAGGTTKCGNACFDESIDPKNCGACNNACTTGNTCSGAHCCPTATPFWCPAEAKCDTLVNCVLKSGGAITAGQSHTCAINPSGALRCWGSSSNGELGNDGSTASSNVPITPHDGTTINLNTGIVATAAWYYGACATMSTGAEYCWGYNPYGQLGNNLKTSTYKPVQVSGISTGVLPAGGGYYGGNCVLLKSGAVSCWGYDEYGGVCQGSITFTDFLTPQTTQVTSGAIGLYGSSTNFYGQICQVTAGGAASCWGEGYYTLGDGTTYESGSPVTIKNVSNVASIANGEENSCVVMKDGTMKCWGWGAYGQNGDGSTTTTYQPSTTTSASVTGIIQACVGYEHTCVVTSAGAVKCVGYNGSGQLGNGSTSSSTTWVTPIASGAISVACGGSHTCALMSNGTAECWGANGSGQLGDGTYAQRTSPVAVSSF